MKFIAECGTTLLLTLLASMLAVPAFAAEGLLDPEVAFRFSARIVDPATVQVRYQIADGYYLSLIHI